MVMGNEQLASRAKTMSEADYAELGGTFIKLVMGYGALFLIAAWLHEFR